ncbi:MAG: DUF423 domain-containing protein [Gammaproteobacteria bacterium]|nr:MAG: DUF423 domain-containing protein [Gammaproteobacteria bacterium]
MNWLSTGALFAALAIMTGAFGAHGLENRLDAHHLAIWHKAVDYHALHGLALVLIGILQRQGTVVAPAGWLLLGGILLFSGSLYLLAITNIRWLGMITPLGGLSFIAGWIVLAFLTRRKTS